MKTVAIVQARFGASRLPGKVFLDLGGVTALQRCVDRVRRISRVDRVIVATSTQPKDEMVAALARRLGVEAIRGSETDVLSRFADVIRISGADIALRITADCPLLDPVHSSVVLEQFTASNADYASNVMERRLPRGLDTEVFRADTLLVAAAEATDPLDREHVTRFLYRQPDRFRCRSVVSTDRDWSGHRWTLDTSDDYHVLFRIHEELGSEVMTASTERIVELVEGSPEISALNAHVRQKES